MTNNDQIREYNEGILAADSGLPHWENPYSGWGCNEEAFQAWYTGWCYGKKDLMEDLL